VDYHHKSEAMATLTLYRVANPLEYGVVVTGEDGRIRQFQEKPSWGEIVTDTINTGIYVLEPSIFEYYQRNQVFDFSKDLFRCCSGTRSHSLAMWRVVTGPM
jgi:mannose-1-phosphate guanylyltransferase/phosphomannomutase